MNDEVLVKVDGVSKKFCRSLKRSLWYGLQDVGAELFGRTGRHDELRKNEFWAVDNVSFELKRGECLGLIGLNGAGKSTLLKMLNGLVKPDKGRITMRGRVGAIIELGAGFNPILTARENIYINGSVLGFTKKEIDRKFDAIVDFAEIEEFIDTPVQNYSSGMKVRLGFAVAAQMEPEVLLIDEVLAVGDIGFKIKCLNTLRSMTSNLAVVFVSHVMQQISGFCTRVMVINRGAVITDTENPQEGVDRYYGLVEQNKQESGTGQAKVVSLTLFGNGKELCNENPVINTNTQLSVILHLRIEQPVPGANLIIVIRDGAENPIRTFPIQDSNGDDAIFSSGQHQVRVSLGPIELNTGRYSFVIALRDALSGLIITRVQGLHPFRVISRFNYWSPGVSPRVAELTSSENESISVD